MTPGLGHPSEASGHSFPWTTTTVQALAGMPARVAASAFACATSGSASGGTVTAGEAAGCPSALPHASRMQTAAPESTRHTSPEYGERGRSSTESIKRLISPVETTKEKRRKELVVAAFNRISAHGFEGLRTRDVADDAGVNIATLHYYFPTKEALIRGVLEHAMGRFRTTLAPHGSPSDQLRNHLRAVRKLMAAEPELSIVLGELAMRSARDKSIATIMAETNEAWHLTMRGLLRRAVKEGSLRPELDSDAVAALVIATLRGMTLPTMTVTPRAGQALRQLERWLGVSGPKSSRSSN